MIQLSISAMPRCLLMYELSNHWAPVLAPLVYRYEYRNLSKVKN